jgi:DNA-binding FadR family transcriptional regulator
MAGLIETHRSSGTFVSKTYTDFLSSRLNLATLLSEREVRDIVEVRTGLEGQTAALAAGRATADQVDKLAQILAAIDEHLANPKQAAEHDMAFHVAIAKASRNSLLLNLILSMRNLIYDYIQFGYSHPLKLNPDDGEHERILIAIRTRQVEQARQAMLEHLASSAEWMLACARNTASKSEGEL